MRLQIIALTIVAAATGGPAHAQLAPSNTVVTPRILTPDTPRFHAKIDDTVATCSLEKKPKRTWRVAQKYRNCLQQR